MPWLSSEINAQLNRVELRPVEPNDDHLSMCVQYERNGKCQVSLHVAEKNQQQVSLNLFNVPLNDKNKYIKTNTDFKRTEQRFT